MTLVTRIRHKLRNGKLGIGHRNIVGRMHGHNPVNDAWHVTVVASTSFRLRRVACVLRKLDRRLVLLVTTETRLVCPVLFGYLSLRIAIVHRVARQTGYSILPVTLLEACRAEDAL